MRAHSHATAATAPRVSACVLLLPLLAGCGGSGGADSGADSGAMDASADVPARADVTPTLVERTLSAADSERCSIANGPAADTGPGGMIAACFTPPAYPAQLRAARFLVANLGQPTTRFGVRLFRGDGANGTPGAEIATRGLTGAATADSSWAEVDLSPAAVTLESGSFCVAMEWLTPFGPDVRAPESQLLCGETGAPVHDRSFILWARDRVWRRFADVGLQMPLDVQIRVTVATPSGDR